MYKTIVGRLAVVVPTLILASLVVFLLVQMIPGSPEYAIAGENATPEALAAIREQLGLNKPLPVQYWDWLTAVLQGDLGRSLVNGEPVLRALLRTAPVTISLVLMALVVSFGIGVPAGIAAAWWSNKPADRALTSFSALGVAVPNFWLGMVLVTIFTLSLRWLPATGYVSFFDNPIQAVRHLLMPALALGIVGASEITRQLRGVMIGHLRSDAMRTHRATGKKSPELIASGLKNSAVTLLSLLSLQVNAFLGGTVVIETVFGLSGLGGMAVRATFQNDVVVIQGVVLTMAILVILTNLLVDVTYRIVDPRIR